MLVRMRGDRFGGKRTNWLLIKHRDADSQDRAMAMQCSKRNAQSHRAARCSRLPTGKGKRPKPFMLATATPRKGGCSLDRTQPAVEPPTARRRRKVAATGACRSR